MNEELACAKLRSAERRVAGQLSAGIERARAFQEKNVKYKWAGKTAEELDCSGLVTMCYPQLPDGVDRQFDFLHNWLFTGSEISFLEQGDIVFFAESDSLSKVSHVGIAERVDAQIAYIIHSSQRQGGVVIDEFNIFSNIFRDTYVAVAIAKIRPFLFRFFLNSEIMRSVRDAP